MVQDVPSLDSQVRSRLAELEWALSYYLRANEVGDPQLGEKRKRFEELKNEFLSAFPNYKDHAEARIMEIETGFGKAERARKMRPKET